MVGSVPPAYWHWRRAANAMDLLDLENGITAWTPTEWQRDLYPAEYRDPIPAADGVQSDSIVATHTLIPEALHHAFSTFGVLMSPELPLTRRQQEMITTVVSVANRCHY
jgi:hypothetical protein